MVTPYCSDSWLPSSLLYEMIEISKHCVTLHSVTYLLHNQLGQSQTDLHTFTMCPAPADDTTVTLGIMRDIVTEVARRGVKVRILQTAKL